MVGWHVTRNTPTEWTWQILKLMLLSVGIALSIWLWKWININRTSMHDFYRFRLVVAYLFCQQKNQRIVPATLDELRLSSMSRLGVAPYHLINATLNLSASRDSATRREAADSFIFSKLFTGSIRTGFAPTELMELADPFLDLGTAMAVSGAAVSPNMGSLTIRPLVALLALLNLRLGYWLPNPAKLDPNAPSSLLPPGPIYFVKELFSKIDENSDYLYVSDGGHRENLGALELLRRRCSVILVGDSEADSFFRFSGLRKVIFLANRDLGIDIEIDEADLQAIARGERHHAVGKTVYADGQEGDLIYFKSSITGDEDALISGYKIQDPSFPHDPTSEQFFTDLQFHCYRRLGYHVGKFVLDFEGRRRSIKLFSMEYREQAIEREKKLRGVRQAITEVEPRLAATLLEIAFKLSTGEYDSGMESMLETCFSACRGPRPQSEALVCLMPEPEMPPLESYPVPPAKERLQLLRGLMRLIELQCPAIDAKRLLVTASDIEAILEGEIDTPT
jgi:hypothetical protein